MKKLKYINSIYSFINESNEPLDEESVWTKPQLNPALWDKDGNLDPKLREKLLKIGKSFYESIELKAPIIDIQLTGSNANYNYNKYSDLDVHIIIDFTKANEDKTLVKKAVDDEKWIWNMRHNIKLKDYSVEVYVQDIEDNHTNNGLYSLLKGEWIEKPDYTEPDTDPRVVQNKAQGYMDELVNLKTALEDAETSEEAESVYNRVADLRKRIADMRKMGLQQNANNIYSIENLAFKELRNNGTIEDMIDLGNKAYDKMYELD